LIRQNAEQVTQFRTPITQGWVNSFILRLLVRRCK
jgi:hypothetical protein